MFFADKKKKIVDAHLKVRRNLLDVTLITCNVRDKEINKDTVGIVHMIIKRYDIKCSRLSRDPTCHTFLRLGESLSID